MSQLPFHPLFELTSRPMPKKQTAVQIYLQGVVKEKVNDTDTSVKQPIIHDKRKYSHIERSIILDNLKGKKAFIVERETTKETVILKPIGELCIAENENNDKRIVECPIAVVKKTERRVTINVPIEKEEVEKEEEEQEELEKEELEKEELEKEEQEELEKEEQEELEKEEEEQEEVEKEVEPEKPAVQKIKKLRIKKNVITEDTLMNPDLSTAKINALIVKDRLPLPKEKVLIRAPAYYMNNRKISVQKLNQLFQPYKEEFMKADDTVSCERNTNADFELLTHQKVVRDYLNIYTPYRGLLLYHNLGTGKSCSSIAIAEGMKSDKRIVVMTPASLKMNFFSELKKCGDPIFKKNQYWEFVSVEGNPTYVGILSKALSLSTEYIREHHGAWLVDIKKQSNFSDKTPEEQKNIDDQLNEMIRSKYVDINYNGINKKGLEKLTNGFTKNPFDDAVVLIDEAHNFVSRIVNKIKRPDSLAYIMYDYLMSANNAKIVLLTGTPIINYPNEIGILYNILRGHIKTWTMPINVKTTEKINTDTILEIFDKENFKNYDYVEYSGNQLIITRNPFGFINTKKRGRIKGKTGGSKTGSLFQLITGGLNMSKKHKKSVHCRSTKKVKSFDVKTGINVKTGNQVVEKITFEPDEDDLDEDDLDEERIPQPEEDPHKGGGEAFDRYNGVKLDDTGNVTDAEYINTVMRILSKNGLEVPVGAIEVKNYKALPDDSDTFLRTFINADSGDVVNMDAFQRRILGLTSYFRSAQERLLPEFVKSEEGDIFHIVRCVMTPDQFGVYEKIRKIEADQERRNKKNAKKGQTGDDLFKISTTYRIFSRSACNFAFPASIERPVPDTREGKEIDENDLNAVPISIRKDSDQSLDEEDIEGEGESDNIRYSERIERALEQLKFNPESPREIEYLTKDALGKYSPKFIEILNRIDDPENIGLHLIYSQFRTIEGIGILKLILEANGYAEFKIKKGKDNEWEIVESDATSGKPKFVLYTGTETTEEKEIIRNIYNSSWELVPSNIATRLREQGENNFMGEVIKIFMITSSGAEGINLKNTRFVHIVEPYWHMVRIEQVIGRARRICSHQDLPEDLRTVQVFLYLSVLSEEQKSNPDHKELQIRDISRLDKKSVVTTDENLFEIASVKNKINRQILKAVKESAMDCALYASSNKEENLVCYNYGKVSSNQFGSYPSFEKDIGEKSDLKVRKVSWKARRIGIGGVQYALNEETSEVYDYDSYLNAKDRGGELVLVGKLIKTGKGFAFERE